MPVNPLIVRYYRTLLATQLLSPAAMRTQQDKLLGALVVHARARVPFYRDSGRLDVLVGRDGAIDLTRWSEVPPLTRVEALQHADALKAETVPPEMQPIEDDCTSGSTGLALPFKRTALANVASAALLARAIHWHGPAPGRLAVFATERRRMLFAASGQSPHAADPRATVSISTEVTPGKQEEELRRLKPTHVVGRANTLMAIAEQAGATFSGMRLVMQAGEVLRPEVRQKLSIVFGCPVVDIYSASELGPIAIEGPLGGLRVSEETLLLETTAGQEELAEVVVTPFYAYAMPLIRYRPRDFVRFSATRDVRAPGLRRLSAIVGRERNLLKRPDGSRFSPEISGWRMFSIVQLSAWRLTQTTPQDVVMEAVFLEQPDAIMLGRLRVLVEAAIRPLQLEIRPVAVIDDDRQTGKSYETFRCLVP